MDRHPVAYLRRSNAGGSNGNGRVSFDMQRAAVLEMAARRGDPDPELIVEWGLSGAASASAFGGTGRGGHRKAYRELRTAIAEDRVAAVYAYSLSRLARSTRELLDLAELCVGHGVPIRLAKEGDIDGTSPSGRLYLTVLAAVSTFEAEVAAERARDRNEMMRERGAYVGRAPYGYLIDDGRLVPDPATAPTLKRILRLYAELKSAHKVARALNDTGEPAPQGGKWGDGSVRRIVRDQPGVRMPRTVRGSRAVPVARYARLLTCPCGRTLIPNRKKYATAAGEPRHWIGYTCPGARFDRGHPRIRSVPESVITDWATVEAARLRTPDRVKIRAEADAQRADLDARRGRVIDALEAGTITRTEAEPRLARIAAEAAALQAEDEVVEVPAIDWSWATEPLNRALQALWSEVRLEELDGRLVPVEAVWRVPEWRV